MCGIVGYIGKRKVLPILMETLKTLEYRGYDSVGVAYYIDNEVKIIKDIGTVNNLEKKISINDDSFVGIGHTRWATHGGVTINNSHPHRQGKITVVHNGIIENHLDIKEKLLNNGYKFKGDTDSEVLAALIDYYYEKVRQSSNILNITEKNISKTFEKDVDIIKALSMVSDELKGSYACAIMIDGIFDKLYAIRKDSPLVIGIGDNENFIASDVTAIIKYTNKYILLDDYDISVLSQNNVNIYNDGKKVKKVVNEFIENVDMTTKQGFPHYMLKEIYEQSTLARTNLMNNLDDIPDISMYKNIYVVACGSAYHAGIVGKYLIEKYINKPMCVDIASEFRYKKLFLSSDDLVIFISQSGETADTLASLRIAKKYGCKTLGIVNVFGSSIAREVDMVIYTNALTEIAVATTKAYMMQVYVLGLIAIKNSNIEYNSILCYYKELSKKINKVLESDVYTNIAKMIDNKKDIFFLGRGIDYYIAMEGSLKLKEISYIHSEAYPAGELKHGTISLIEKNTPVISIITDNNIKNKTLSNVNEVISRGAMSIIVCTDDIDVDSNYYDVLITIPNTIDVLKPILAIIPLQLIAYEVARLNNCDIDKPRNLAKSVTVE